jgi:plasmid stability protein
MAVTLSIENVPDEMVERLRERAARHGRSLQGELTAILEKAVAAPRRLTPHDVLTRVQEHGLSAPREAAAMVREDRDIGGRR